MKAFKEAVEDRDGLPNEEEGEAFMKFMDNTKGNEFLCSMVLLQSRDPGFVAALDTDDNAERSSIQIRGPDCREGV